MNRSMFMACAFALFFGSAGVLVAAPSSGDPLSDDPGNTVSGPDPIFNFTFTIGPNAGFGSLNTVDNGGGSFHAIGGSLTITGGLDVGSYSLGSAGPANESTPTGGFIVNNLLFPALNPAVDTAGLFFLGNDLELNIFALGTNYYVFASCRVSTGDCGNGTYNVLDFDEQASFAVSAVPEPTTLALLGLGLVGLAASRRRSRAS